MKFEIILRILAPAIFAIGLIAFANSVNAADLPQSGFYTSSEGADRGLSLETRNGYTFVVFYGYDHHDNWNGANKWVVAGGQLDSSGVMTAPLERPEGQMYCAHCPRNAENNYITLGDVTIEVTSPATVLVWEDRKNYWITFTKMVW